MHQNNYVPTIVEKSARRATRNICSGSRAMRYYKKSAHRAYRRNINMQLHDIAKGDLDWNEYDDTALGTARCSSWDIW